MCQTNSHHLAEQNNSLRPNWQSHLTKNKKHKKETGIHLTQHHLKLMSETRQGPTYSVSGQTYNYLAYEASNNQFKNKNHTSAYNHFSAQMTA
jgi:hypothetical protein